MATPTPTAITLHRASHVLEVAFDSDESFRLSCEYLRVHSPSAEVQGHGPSQKILQLGKQHVNINEIRPVGQYGVTLVFDDGHDTGIYSWDTLYDLGRHKEAYRHLRHYTEIAPRLSWGWCWRGKAAHAIGESDEARSDYLRAIDLEHEGGEETDATELLADLDHGPHRDPGPAPS